MRFSVLSVAVLLVSPIALRAQATPGRPDEGAVRAVVEQYLHGLKFNDTTSLRAAFLPEARLYYATADSQLGSWTHRRHELQTLRRTRPAALLTQGNEDQFRFYRCRRAAGICTAIATGPTTFPGTCRSSAARRSRTRGCRWSTGRPTPSTR